MTNGAAWAQVLTLGAVVLGGIITMATTWLTNLQQNTDRSRERREGRLVPVYLSLHLAVRDWVLLLETHALSGFPPGDLENMAGKLRGAWDTVHRTTYQIDLMSPPQIAFETDLLEDSLIRLTEHVGFRLRLASLPQVPEAQDQNYVRTELRSISDRRMRLVELMQNDLSLRKGQGLPMQIWRAIAPRSLVAADRHQFRQNPLQRDQNNFIIDDGRYIDSEVSRRRKQT
jgi:hypothetical protein